MNESHVAKEDTAVPVRKARGILPGLIWISLLFVSLTLAKGLVGKGHVLLSACAMSIWVASAPLLLRWGLVRVHGIWSRVSRGDRIAVYVGDAIVLTGLVTIFVMAYIRTQQLEAERSPQDTLWHTSSMEGAKAYSAGRYTEAQKLLELAVTEAEKFDPPDPRLARSLNNLAMLYKKQGKVDQSESLFMRAVSIYEEFPDTGHTALARCLSNLAALYLEQFKLKRAEPLFERSLAIREKSLGPAHPDVATTLNNMAAMYRKRGKDDRAEPLFKRSLAIFEKGSDPEHPELGNCLDNLAELYQTQGKYDRAEPLFKRSLAILEKVHGPEHPYVARVLESYGELLKATDRMDEAEAMQKRAAAIRKKYEK